MKNVFALIAIMLVFAACGNNNRVDDVIENGGYPTPPVYDTKTLPVFNIGIMQLTDHHLLNEAYEGFIAAFEHYGIPAEFDYQNAMGYHRTLWTIAESFLGNDLDLVYTIGGLSVQTMAAATQTLPVVASAVTCYETLGVANHELFGINVTGTSDMNPIEYQIDLILEFVPHTRILGISYNSSDSNSIHQARIAAEYAESLGIIIFESDTVTTHDIEQNITALAGSADAVWIPVDETHTDAMPLIRQISIDTGVPVFAGENQMTRDGGIATIVIDYFKLGYEAGRMARDILVYNHCPSEMPIRYSADIGFDYIVNGYMAEKTGLTIPERLLPYVF
jgi:putative ABC transport system substrate-binding protein